MKRQRERLRQILQQAREKSTGNGSAMPEPDPYSYEDPREMAEIWMVLARDVPEALPGATHDDFDDADEDELRAFAEVAAAEAAFAHSPEDPEGRKRAAEGIAAIMKKYPEAWDLSGDSPADYTERELREAVLDVMKQAMDGPPLGEGPEPPKNTA